MMEDNSKPEVEDSDDSEDEEPHLTWVQKYDRPMPQVAAHTTHANKPKNAKANNKQQTMHLTRIEKYDRPMPQVVKRAVQQINKYTNIGPFSARLRLSLCIVLVDASLLQDHLCVCFYASLP